MRRDIDLVARETIPCRDAHRQAPYTYEHLGFSSLATVKAGVRWDATDHMQVAQEEFLYLVAGATMLPLRSATTGLYVTVVPPARPAAGGDALAAASGRSPASTPGAAPAKEAAPTVKDAPAAGDAKKRAALCWPIEADRMRATAVG